MRLSYGVIGVTALTYGVTPSAAREMGSGLAAAAGVLFAIFIFRPIRHHKQISNMTARDIVAAC
jgi:hypothetical protein